MAPEAEWIAYVNGEYVPQSEAKLSIFDHGILYGDGVFDTCCTWNGYIFKLDQHVDRLFRSSRAAMMVNWTMSLSVGAFLAGQRITLSPFPGALASPEVLLMISLSYPGTMRKHQ